MKWKDNIWGYLIAFITGVLLCYLSLQFSSVVSEGTSNKISKCQKREIKPLSNN